MPIQQGEEKGWARPFACSSRCLRPAMGTQNGRTVSQPVPPLACRCFSSVIPMLRRQNVVGSQSPFWRDTLQRT